MITINQQLHRLTHKDVCDRCDKLDAATRDDVFYADYPSYEYFGNDGTMTYRPLGRYGLVIWPKGWRKKYDGLYPTFNIYRKEIAAWEFMDHSNFYEPGNIIAFRTKLKG